MHAANDRDQMGDVVYSTLETETNKERSIPPWRVLETSECACAVRRTPNQSRKVRLLMWRLKQIESTMSSHTRKTGSMQGDASHYHLLYPTLYFSVLFFSVAFALLCCLQFCISF